MTGPGPPGDAGGPTDLPEFAFHRRADRGASRHEPEPAETAAGGETALAANPTAGNATGLETEGRARAAGGATTTTGGAAPGATSASPLTPEASSGPVASA